MSANAFKTLYLLLSRLAPCAQYVLNEKKVSKYTPGNFGLWIKGSSASSILIFGRVMACADTGKHESLHNITFAVVQRSEIGRYEVPREEFLPGFGMGMAMLLIKAGDVETNPGPTTTHKLVWICNICHRQIQVKMHISIICNRIEHWVHIRCIGIRLAQYADTWTCHQHT